MSCEHINTEIVNGSLICKTCSASFAQMTQDNVKSVQPVPEQSDLSKATVYIFSSLAILFALISILG